MTPGHVCVFHRGPAERDALLRDFLAEGAAAGEKCLCIAEATDPETATVELTRTIGTTPAAGQLTVLTTDAYLTDGRFVPDRCVAQWDALLSGYVAEGFGRIRATADVGGTLRHGVTWEPLLDYEAECNRLSHHPVTIYCFYDLDRFGSSRVAGILERHTGAVAGGVYLDAPRPEAVAGTGRRPWAAGEAAGHQSLVLANLLLAGAAGDEEIGDLVANVCAAAIDVDLAAVAWPVAGGWTARGVIDGVPLAGDLAARIARAAQCSEPPGPVVGWPLGDVAATVLHPIVHAGSVLGWLVAGSREPTSLDYGSTFLSALALLAGPYLAAGRLAGERHQALARVAELEERLRTLPAGGDDPADVLRQVLDGAGSDPGLEERLRAFGLDPAPGARVVVVRPATPAATPGVRARLAERGLRLVTTRGREIVFAAPEGPDLDGAVAAVSAVGQPAGVGGVAHDVDGLGRSYGDARQTAALAAGLGRAVLRHDDLGLFALLADGGDPARMERFAGEWIGALVGYDEARGNNSDLVGTLAAYLDAGSNQLATAEALGIHVSTLKYRLRRIEEVSGFKLSDPDQRFHLQVALHVRRTLDVLSH